MNRKAAILFCVVDFIVFLSSIAFMVYENHRGEIGLAALSSAGRFLLFGMVGIISGVSLIIVSVILFFKRKK